MGYCVLSASSGTESGGSEREVSVDVWGGMRMAGRVVGSGVLWMPGG